ncbi:MAG: futalosine hydrolase [Bacteroidota bacterium]
MNILLVAATPPETAQIREQLGIDMEQTSLGSAHFASHKIDLLHTGIGMVNTAYHMGRYLALHQVDQAINFGIAGSFDRSLALGEVVEIREDSFSELGAEDGEAFLDLGEMGFPLSILNGKAVYNSLQNPWSSPFDLKNVKALTINRVHGNTASIKKTQQRWKAEVESMEGAAFFHACLEANIPFYALRSISNYVERRDKSKWNIPLALSTVQNLLFQHLNESLL